MTNTNSQIIDFEKCFDQFVAQYSEMSTTQNEGLVTYFEKDWFSPCFSKLATNSQDSGFNEQDFTHGEKISWRAVKRVDNQNLKNIETALEISIPIELQVLFCRYFSMDLNASTNHGHLTILQALNSEDFDRLQKNLIAHVLMKRRLKQDDTLFFALTDEEDFILSIDVLSGAVVLEEVGKQPQRQIADNLTSFISTLEPKPQLVTL